jgi:trigger factor
MKERIASDLQNEANHYVKFETLTNMLNKLMDENMFEVPRSVVNEQAERMAQQSIRQYYQMGINPEMFGVTAKSMVSRYYGEAERQVKHALIINRLAEKQGITISNEDINKEVERIAEVNERNADDVRKEMLENEHNLPAMQNDLLADKVYAFLCNENSIDEKEITRGEFEKKRMEEAEKARAAGNTKEDATDEINDNEANEQ